MSIIIPAYNVEKYIGDCLESIINQTYKNIEVIVINDGSKDNTFNVIKSYAEKDNRIKAIDQKNQGVSATRNNGIELAAGDYFTFFDSDDYIPKSAIEALVNEAEKTKVDIVVANFSKIKNGKELSKLKKIEKICAKEEALEELFNEVYINCSVWNKLFKREVFGTEKYDKTLKVAEDFDFLYRVMKHADKVAINTNETVYHYFVRENSAMQGNFDSKFEKEIPLCERIIEEIKEEYPEIIDSAIRRYQRAIVSCLSKCLKETGSTKQVDYLYEKLNKYPLKLKGYNRIRVFLLKYFKPGLKWIYRIYEKI